MIVIIAIEKSQDYHEDHCYQFLMMNINALLSVPHDNHWSLLSVPHNYHNDHCYHFFMIVIIAIEKKVNIIMIIINALLSVPHDKLSPKLRSASLSFKALSLSSSLPNMRFKIMKTIIIISSSISSSLFIVISSS